MTNAKFKLLEKYKSLVLSKLADPIPQKHKGHSAQYTNFLRNELRLVSSKIETILEGRKG